MPHNRNKVLEVKYLEHYEGDPLKYANVGDAGFDLKWSGQDSHGVLFTQKRIMPNEIFMAKTGVAFDIRDEHYEIQVRPRSGLACNKGLTVVNAPGTIDSGYQGEVMVGLINLSTTPVNIHRGDRIAQAVMAPVCRCTFVKVTEFEETTQRGENGFGSTGTQ